MDSKYDYIIVGAGTAGCALAYQLSRDADNRVLLLEAGGADKHPMIHIPLGFAFLVKHKKINWGYQTDPEPELRDRRIDWPRGKVLGGCSSINGMVHIRGQREDFDHWASLGNCGWSFDDLLPYFKRHEHNTQGGNQYRGVGGPLWVDEVACQFDMSGQFVQAAVDEGFSLTDDFNGEQQEGVGYFQVNIKNGRRQSSVDAFLKQSRSRPNLKVQTHALTTEVLIEGNRAVGVSVGAGGRLLQKQPGGDSLGCANPLCPGGG